MTITITKCPDQFSETAIDEEIVVMSLESGDFFSLSGTGRTIWQLLDNHSKRVELLAELARSYGLDESAIAAEFDLFIASLSQAGLVACT